MNPSTRNHALSATVMGWLLPVGLILLSGCDDRKTAVSCPDQTQVQTIGHYPAQGFLGLDILLVIDNSPSMAEKHEQLATGVMQLINALALPVPSWPWPPLDDIRIAVITGDNSAFITGAASSTVSILADAIPCGGNEPDRQCPPGWTCEGLDDSGTGLCRNSSGEEVVSCPEASSESPGPAFTETAQRDTLPLTAACLANRGTDGCAMQQPLAAAAEALSGDSIDEAFMREQSAMLVLVISNGDDCSVRDASTLCLEDGLTDSDTSPVACDAPADALYPVEEIRQMWIDAKARVSGDGHAAGSVMFSAVVDVSAEGDSAIACQGRGSDIADCPVGELTSAARFVQLAQAFENRGHVYSIANEDWSPAIEDAAVMIHQILCCTCLTQSAGYDPVTSTSPCRMVLEFRGTECPAGVDWAAQTILSSEDDDRGPVVSCKVPALARPLDCAALSEEQVAAMYEEETGWYYCENTGENFSDACSDGLDNDGDGDIDCDDSECAFCGGCVTAALSDPDRCPSKCRFDVQITRSIREAFHFPGILGNAIQCLPESPSDSPDCASDTAF